MHEEFTMGSGTIFKTELYGTEACRIVKIPLPQHGARKIASGVGGFIAAFIEIGPPNLPRLAAQGGGVFFQNGKGN